MRLAAVIAILFTCVHGMYAGEPIVRVRIVSTLPLVTLVPQSNWRLSDGSVFPAGHRLHAEARGSLVLLSSGDGVVLRDTLITLLPPTSSAAIRIEKVPFGVGWWWQGAEDRIYEGTIHLRALPGGLMSVIVELPMEQYLDGVVPYEIGPDSPIEALKAQVVAARSETVVALASGMYKGDAYDICADVECQVFGGIGKRTTAVERAIAETRGIVLSDHGTPINAYYASNCGGHTENIELIWPDRSGPRPYWSGHPDSEPDEHPALGEESVLRRWLLNPPAVWCNPSGRNGMSEWNRKYFRWSVTTPAESLSAWIQPTAAIGRVLKIDSLRRGVSGRILQGVLVGETGSLRVTDQLAFRKLWQPTLRSSCVLIETVGPSARPDAFVLTGAGWGHGVGMCQTGAIAMALSRKDHREILHHYYRGAVLVSLY